MSAADETVVVLPDDKLADVIDRLREAARVGGPVRLVVPIDSSLLLTATEFRTLKDVSDEERLPVVLRTADPLRLQLASRLGVPAEALPRARPALARAPAAPTEPTSPEIVAPAQTAEDWPGTPPRIEPAAAWPVREAPQADPLEETAETNPSESAKTARWNPPRLWLPIVVALVLLVAGAYFGVRYLVPSVVITFVPKTASAAESLVFDVTEDGAPADATAAFALAPQKREIEVVWEGSIPVTGVRVEPDGSAAGPVELRNPSAEPAMVDSGTVVTTEAGAQFAFDDDIAVPAADANARPGEATGNVRAVDPGSGSNIALGELGGRLPSGVYYSNRLKPTEGGTDKEFPVVSENDLTALAEAAKNAAPDLITAEIGKEAPNANVLATSVNVTDQQDEFNAAVGADAETLSVRSTMNVEFATYDEAAARKQYEPLLLKLLSDKVPDGYMIDPQAVTFEGPSEQTDDNDTTRLHVTANAVAVAKLDDAEKRRLASALVGLDAERATALLATSPAIERYEVDYQPAWLAGQMPANPDRIVIEAAT